MLKSIGAGMMPNAGQPGILNTARPSAPQMVTLDGFDAQRKAAQDAAITHQRMVANEKALIAQLGPQGYSKALALAQQQAQATSAALRAASGFVG